MKTCKILSIEQSQNCPEMKHYKILYRGREYVETTKNYDSPVYEVGSVYCCDTFKDGRGNLCFGIYKKLKGGINL